MNLDVKTVVTWSITAIVLIAGIGNYIFSDPVPGFQLRSFSFVLANVALIIGFSSWYLAYLSTKQFGIVLLLAVVVLILAQFVTPTYV